ncbi:hypothetical protein K501DRAFT_276393 [Backusella circina FSU 941]|nr:hypothetical protein K501DRAFT_276393 [Backusella circina FSU 941]
MTFDITLGISYATLERAESAVQAEAKKEGFSVSRRGSYLGIDSTAETLKSPIVILHGYSNALYVPLLCKSSKAFRKNPFILRYGSSHYNTFFVDFDHLKYGNPPPFRLNNVTRNLIRTRHDSYFANDWEEVFPGCYSDNHDYKGLPESEEDSGY